MRCWSQEEKDWDWTQIHTGSDSALEGVQLEPFPLDRLKLIGNLLLVLNITAVLVDTVIVSVYLLVSFSRSQ